MMKLYPIFTVTVESTMTEEYYQQHIVEVDEIDWTNIYEQIKTQLSNVTIDGITLGNIDVKFDALGAIEVI